MHAPLLSDESYPYKELLKLLLETKYDGWVMLEDGSVPNDPVAELARQLKLFDTMI